MQNDDATGQAGGGKPRKLTIAREKLRVLGGTSLTRAGAGMEEATTTEVCDFIIKAITQKVVSDVFSAVTSAVVNQSAQSVNASCPSVVNGEGPGVITDIGCPSAVTCAQTCYTCVNPPLTAPLQSQTTCPGFGCQPAIPAQP